MKFNTIYTKSLSAEYIHDVSEASGGWNDVVTTVATTSGNWDNARSTLLSNSGDWNSVESTLLANSANWDSTRSTLLANSGDWNSVESTLLANSGNWDNARSTVLSNSAGWESVESTVTSNSANWDSARSTLLSNSGDWDSVEATLLGTSGKWESTHATLLANSADWNSVESTLLSNSGLWDNTRSTVLASSAAWGMGGPTTGFIPLSGSSAINGHLIPVSTSAYDLGSSTNAWRDLWVASGSIHLGALKLTTDGTNLLVNGSIISGGGGGGGITGYTDADITSLSGTVTGHTVDIASLSSTIVNGYSDTFTSGNLVSGQLTVTHNLNASPIFVTVQDNANKYVVPADIITVSDNQNILDFDSAVVAGTWKLRMAVGGIGSLPTGLYYSDSFVNGDLVSGVLTVAHNLNYQHALSVIVESNSGTMIIPDNVTYTSVNALAVDLATFGTIGGTWYVRVLPVGGVVAGGSAYTSSFTNANLVSGDLTVSHNLNAQHALVVVVEDNTTQLVEPDNITYSGLNSLVVSLSSYGAITGTWQIRVLNTGGSVGTSVSNTAWNGSNWTATDTAPSQLATQNALTGTVSNTAWTGANWSDTTIAPSKHATEHALLTRGEWTLVERKTFDAPATSYTLSGLNGNTDRRYKLKTELKNNYAGTNQFFATINGDNTAAHYNFFEHGTYKTTGDGAGTIINDRSPYSSIRVGWGSAQNNWGWCEVVIEAFSGRNRHYSTSENSELNSTEIWKTHRGDGLWLNSADNITSITVTSTNASGIGIGSYVELWKLAQ